MLAAGGGCSCHGGGGFTGGYGQSLGSTNDNGYGGIGTNYWGGSGYFSAGTATRTAKDEAGFIGGQGGGASVGWEAGGDGGVAGCGGSVTVSSTATLYAYNGDRITNGDYTTTYYEYEADGTITTTVSNVLTKNDENNTKFIPLTIYAQSGILRAVYKGNYYWNYDDCTTYSYLYSLLSNTLIITEDISSSSYTVAKYCIREETTCSTTGYTNPATGSSQGIGSGAGYIEVSNGTYTVLD